MKWVHPKSFYRYHQSKLLQLALRAPRFGGPAPPFLWPTTTTTSRPCTPGQHTGWSPSTLYLVLHLVNGAARYVKTLPRRLSTTRTFQPCSLLQVFNILHEKCNPALNRIKTNSPILYARLFVAWYGPRCSIERLICSTLASKSRDTARRYFLLPRRSLYAAKSGPLQ